MVWPLVSRFELSADPIGELRRLQREMSCFFDDYAGNASPYPLLNLWGTPEEAVVEALVPGMEPKDLSITLQGDVLLLEGERKAEAAAEKVTAIRLERSAGRFSRTVRLPFEVEPSKVAAKYENGLVRITLPRKESTKPRRIAIAQE